MEVCMNKKQYIDALRSEAKWLDESLYGSHYRADGYSVDVKLHGKAFADVSDVIDGYKKRYHERIREQFTDEEVSRIWYEWVEFEQRYVIEDWLKGCTITSEEWWLENVGKKIEAGESTGYPYIDKLKSKASKMRRLGEWIRKDKKEGGYINKIQDAGFYGRQGGHFCITPVSGLELHDTMYRLSDELEAGECTLAIARCDADSYLHEARAVRWVLDTVKRMSESMEFAEELRNHIDDAVSGFEDDDKRAREVKYAGTIAKKYGYILAKEVV